MIFKQWEQVLDRSKTQTRRVKRHYHKHFVSHHRFADFSTDWDWVIYCVKTQYLVAGETRERELWAVGKTYAVQIPGGRASRARGGKAVGRIKTNSIKIEKVQDISDDDLIKEGFFVVENGHKVPDRAGFIVNWNNMYANDPIANWGANPEVFVIDFELIRTWASDAELSKRYAK